MDLTTIIQVAIGVMFVWVVLAVITSQIQEWIASILSWRSSMLEDAINTMFGNQQLREQFYEHPLIKGLFTNHGKRKPAGIQDDKFSLVVLEMLIEAGKKEGEIKSTFESLKQGIENLKGQDGFDRIASSLDTLLIGVEERADKTIDMVTESRHRLEGWFNNSMERLGGAYRRRVQIVAIIVGIVVAAALNVDTGAIMTTLWRNPVIRQAVVAQASQLPEAAAQTNKPNTQPTQPPSTEDIVKNMDKLNALSLPIGWSFKTADIKPETIDDPRDFPPTFGGWVAKIIGILLSGMAAAQGAPYWFDLMRKLVTRNPPVPPAPS